MPSAPVRSEAQVQVSLNVVGNLRDRIFRQRVGQMGAFGHHHGVNAEDALFPLRHEHFFFKKIDRPEIFQAAEIVLESHDPLRLDNRLGDGATSTVMHAIEKTVL